MTARELDLHFGAQALRQWCETCQAATTSYICPTCGDTNCSQCEAQCQTVWCLPDDELDRRNAAGGRPS